MIDGWIEIVETPALSQAQAIAWADAVEGSLARLAVMILDPTAEPAAAQPAGRAWGLTLLRRAGLASPEAVDAALAESLKAARSEARRLGVGAFPAVLAVALARHDLAGRAPGPLARRLKLIAASATGRL
jgi:hypothetical protein